MRGNELLDEMELVDPAYVEDAEVYPKHKKRISWKAVAAIVCVVLGGWLIWKFFPDGGNGVQEPPPPPVTCPVGNTISNRYGTLVFHTDDYENRTIAFTLILEERMFQKIVASMEGSKYLSSWVEVINGKEYVLHDSERVFARTPSDMIDYVNHAGQWGMLVITVDGQPATYLPSRAGTYEIRIDYSKVYEACDELKARVYISDFGYLLIEQVQNG